MGIAERREREKEALRTRIVEAARDIVSADGLDALSMRAIAQRVEYSPATLYLYFRDKEALLREVIVVGFQRLGAYVHDALEEVGTAASPADQYLALGRGYVRFAIENTAYFRVMFELPTVAHLDSSEDCYLGATKGGISPDLAAEMVQRAIDDGYFQLPDARRAALVGWGLVHGLTSLYLSGHLANEVGAHGDLLDLVEEAMAMLQTGWLPRETRVARVS